MRDDLCNSYSEKSLLVGILAGQCLGHNWLQVLLWACRLGSGEVVNTYF